MLSMVFLFALLGPISPGMTAPTNPPFRLHLFTEPTQFLAHQQRNSNAGYVLTQTNWGYLRYQEGKLIPGLASACRWIDDLNVRCDLKKNLKFSDGKPIAAADFERVMRRILDPKNPARRADLLFPVKNAKAILGGQEPFEKLGVTFGKNRVDFKLEEKNSDFLFNLSSPYFSPIQDLPDPKPETLATWPTTGPYKFKSYVPSNKIVLEPNPYFEGGHAKRPLVEFLFVADDAVALNLYRTGKLDFNRRLPTMNIPEFEGKPEFHAIPLLRFDHIGLRSFLKPEQRAALATALDYAELQKLFHAKPRPGCPGIPAKWVGKEICHDFAPVGKEKGKALAFPARMQFLFSRLGGDDHRRAMEWIQDQWRKNIGVDIELQQMENQLFVARLEKEGALLFRKGVSLDRPTCLAAVEVFHSSSPENYLRLSSKEYDDMVEKMRGERDEKKRHALCASAVSFLMRNHWVIPTGPIYFSILASNAWKGWTLNELNELDLSGLHPAH